MTNIEILRTLQFLKPLIKVSIFDVKPTQETVDYETREKSVFPCQNFEHHTEVDGKFIIYNETEDFRPTTEEILAVDQNLVNEHFLKII